MIVSEYVAMTWWDRNFDYILYALVAVTISICYFILKRKD